MAENEMTRLPVSKNNSNSTLQYEPLGRDESGIDFETPIFSQSKDN